MKKIIFLLLLTLPVLTLFAQSKKEKQVATAVEQLRKAMVDGNATILNKLASPNLSYGHSGGAIDDKKIFLDKLVSGKSDFVTINLSEQTIYVNGKIAIVRHKLDAATNDNGKPAEVHLKVMTVWQKKRGQWKLLARQAIKL
jgi:ketosteroid isomerase-like protein